MIGLQRTPSVRCLWFRLLKNYSLFTAEREAHQEILRYATKISRVCPDCSVMHREEFLMKEDFGLDKVAEVIDSVKRVVETKGMS